ncbi:uncharacterized protein LOC141598620 [Silene latifolia]|uniref:uncharacterized protein LOC141598620 n=1 Tax=Silene latifolia TaxID=37657 RepID=UPI003D770415
MDQNQPQLSAIADNLAETLTLDLSPNDEDYDNNGDFEFSFVGEEIQSPVSAEKAFLNGQIRPLFPYTAEDTETTSFEPPASKVFVAAAEGEYCEWSTSALTSPEMRKKCNSTGFSKLWRMKDLLVRSNSDGKDTFVFLNGKQAEAATEEGKKKKRGVNFGRIMSFSTNAGGEKGKGKEKEKTETTTVAEVFEELYGKKKGKVGGGGGGGGNKSYLPYRQDLVGFFTNGNGMTRNVHPY